MRPGWREHLDALSRFNAWEMAQLRQVHTTYSEALAWLSEARELATRYGPPFDEERHAQERLEYWSRVRHALSKARLG